MPQFYVELAIDEGIVPMAIEVDSLDEVDKRAERIFPYSHLGFSTILSPVAGSSFQKVDGWPAKEMHPLPLAEFRTMVQELLAEGKRIVEQSDTSALARLFPGQARYTHIPADTLHIALNCPSTFHEGDEYLLFNPTEVVFFMALMIREGILRRLT